MSITDRYHALITDQLKAQELYQKSMARARDAGSPEDEAEIVAICQHYTGLLRFMRKKNKELDEIRGEERQRASEIRREADARVIEITAKAYYHAYRMKLSSSTSNMSSPIVMLPYINGSRQS